MEQNVTDLTAIMTYLDAQIARAVEEVVRLREMQAQLRRATRPLPSVGPPAPVEPPTPGVEVVNGRE